MELKFIFSLFVLLHLKECVFGCIGCDVEPIVRQVDDCMIFVSKFPEEAKGFSENDATQKDLKVAIHSMMMKMKNSTMKSDPTRLTQCYEIRKVKST